MDRSKQELIDLNNILEEIKPLEAELGEMKLEPLNLELDPMELEPLETELEEMKLDPSILPIDPLVFDDLYELYSMCDPEGELNIPTFIEIEKEEEELEEEF